MYIPLVLFIIPYIIIITGWDFFDTEAITIAVLTAAVLAVIFLDAVYCRDGQEGQGVYCSEGQGSACG
jgi:hypothetical protein